MKRLIVSTAFGGEVVVLSSGEKSLQMVPTFPEFVKSWEPPLTSRPRPAPRAEGSLIPFSFYSDSQLFIIFDPTLSRWEVNGSSQLYDLRKISGWRF